MPRKPRIEYPGAFYHIICRGNNREQLFKEERDYKMFLESVETKKRRYEFILYCYNLMPNHLHLLLETVEEPLSRIMCSLLTRYARYFNNKYKRTGHVFERRYKAILCQKENYLLELIRYIHLNDKRAGIVKEIGEWKWSSYRAYIGVENSEIVDIKAILSMFNKNIAIARKKFVKFIYEGISIGKKGEYYPPDTFPYLGDAEFIEDISKRYGEVRRSEKVKIRIGLDKLANKVSEKTGISMEEMRISSNKSKEISSARKILSYIAIYYAGYRMVDVARYLRCSFSTTSVQLRKIKGEKENIERAEAIVSDIKKKKK